MAVPLGMMAAEEFGLVKMTYSDVRKTLSENLHALMEDRDVAAKALQLKTGVGRSTINNIRYKQSNATIKNVDALAAYFRLPAWALLLPGLDIHIKGQDLEDLVSRFLSASPDGRTGILRLALSEANLARSSESRSE